MDEQNQPPEDLPQIPWLSDQIDALPIEFAVMVEIGLFVFVAWIVFYTTKNVLSPCCINSSLERKTSGMISWFRRSLFSICRGFL